MGDIINLNKENTISEKTEYKEIIDTANTLIDEVELDKKKVKFTIPFAELEALGAGVASIIPAFRTVTTTSTVDGKGLYEPTNMTATDVLKRTKDGDAWGSFKTAEGKSKMLRIKEAGNIESVNVTTVPVDPVSLMIIATLYSINKEIKSIKAVADDIFNMLAISKRSEIKADLSIMNEILDDYKDFWNNKNRLTMWKEKFGASYRYIRTNCENCSETIKGKLSKKAKLTSGKKVDQVITDLYNEFTYYRMSVYAFAMASMLEVMLTEDYSETSVEKTIGKIRDKSTEYRNLYKEASEYVENSINKTVGRNLLKGVEVTSGAVGRLIEKVPVIKNGPIDELLIAGSDKLNEIAAVSLEEILINFSKIGSAKTGVFVDKLEEMKVINNQTEQIYFDGENVYLVG